MLPKIWPELISPDVREEGDLREAVGQLLDVLRGPLDQVLAEQGAFLLVQGHHRVLGHQARLDAELLHGKGNHVEIKQLTSKAKT